MTAQTFVDDDDDDDVDGEYDDDDDVVVFVSGNQSLRHESRENVSYIFYHSNLVEAKVFLRLT